VLLSTVTKELQQRGTYTNITDEYIAELEEAEKEVEIDLTAGVLSNGENQNPTGTNGDETQSQEQAESGEQEAGQEGDAEASAGG